MPAATAKTKLFRPRGVEENGLKYYQERNVSGDYVVVDPASARYYRETGQPGKVEARCTAIRGLVSSVCTATVAEAWLRTKCNRVRRADVPAEWLEVLG